VRYTLHTAGPLSLLEMGEAYKQHNRHLLRGYLLVVDDVRRSPRCPGDLETRTRACRSPWNSTSAPSRNNCSTWSGCAPSRT
jgi:hypothetical protein